MARLGDICEILDSKRVPVTAADRQPGPYPYYGANGVQDYVADYIFDDELVLLAEDGGNFGSKDKPIAYRVSGKCWVNNHAHVLKPKQGLDIDYLCYSLMFYDVSGLVNGATRQKLTQADMRKMEIPVPPLEEQCRIAALLDKVSDLIAKRRAQLDKLDLLVKARFVEMFGDPVSNEKNWTNVSLGDIAEIRIGPFGSLLHKEDYITGGHALVNPSHIIDGQICVDENLTISDEKYDELSAYQLEVDDIVLGRRGEMGRCAVVHQKGLLCGTGSIIIRPNVLMKPYFLQNIISNPAYKKIIEDKAVGVTMMNLNVPIVSELKVPLLPVHLQEQFIDFMDQVDKSKLTIQQSLDKLETLKKAMMQQYFDEHGANRRFREI